MKKIITLMLTLSAFMPSAQAQITETATDAVKNMGMGWNLGNTLDAQNCATTDVTSDSYWGCQGLESETCWGQPTTTKELITMMKNAGFGAIRVPVTWYNHMDKNGNVNAEWMARVKEVIDYVIDNGLYCILNVHHDTGADSNTFISWLKADETNYANNKARYEKLWNQIATEFKDYDNHLLFESYNEMLDANSNWNAPSNTSSYNAINNYAQSFVNAVRATGGNNGSRNLIVNTYAAANNEPVQKLTIPTDNVANHIAVEVHAYPNFFTWSTPSTLRTISQVKSDVDYVINNLKTNLIAKGTPAIIGEWGSYGVNNGTGKTDYDVRKDMFFEFCQYFITQAKNNNIAMFYWMGMSDAAYRQIPAFNQADLAELFCETYHGSTAGYEFPTAGSSTTITAFEGEKALDWGDGGRITIDGVSFDMVGSSVKLIITYKQTTDTNPDIQLYYGDWSSKPTFTVDGKNYDGDFNPAAVYGTGANTDHVTTITFDEATYKNLVSKGLIVFGTGETVTKIELSNESTGITSVIADENSNDNAIYNMAGQRISSPKHGLYIKGGKVYIAK